MFKCELFHIKSVRKISVKRDRYELLELQHCLFSSSCTDIKEHSTVREKIVAQYHSMVLSSLCAGSERVFENGHS